MLNEKAVIKFARALAFDKWYTPTELDAVWGVNKVKRRAIVPAMNKRQILCSRGKTANIQYKLQPEPFWQVTPTELLKKTGNGVIDAKLRKEVGLPTTPSSLENLISAATTLGTENEILRDKLTRIRAILEEA